MPQLEPKYNLRATIPSNSYLSRQLNPELRHITRSGPRNVRSDHGDSSEQSADAVGYRAWQDAHQANWNAERLLQELAEEHAGAATKAACKKRHGTPMPCS